MTAFFTSRLDARDVQEWIDSIEAATGPSDTARHAIRLAVCESRSLITPVIAQQIREVLRAARERIEANTPSGPHGPTRDEGLARALAIVNGNWKGE